MQTCRRCRRPVVVGAQRCKHCGTADPAPPKVRRTSPGRLVAIGSVVVLLLLSYAFVDRYRDGQARQEACQAETVQEGVQPGSLAFDTAVAECVDSG